MQAALVSPGIPLEKSLENIIQKDVEKDFYAICNIRILSFCLDARNSRLSNFKIVFEKGK